MEVLEIIFNERIEHFSRVKHLRYSLLKLEIVCQNQGENTKRTKAHQSLRVLVLGRTCNYLSVFQIIRENPKYFALDNFNSS